MLKIQTEEQCKHQGCHCPKRTESDYCSDYCETAPVEEPICNCGHPDCK